MNLVLGRAVQHMFEHRAERQPDMTVTQVSHQPVEDEHQPGHAEQSIAADLAAAGVPEDAGIGADADDRREFFDNLFHEMNPAGGRWNQHRRRMMDFVECPQPSGMEGAVRPVGHEVFHQENAQPVEQGQ